MNMDIIQSAAFEMLVTSRSLCWPSPEPTQFTTSGSAHPS